MVFSPRVTPIYCNPYFGDPQNGAPNFGKPPYENSIIDVDHALLASSAREVLQARAPPWSGPVRTEILCSCFLKHWSNIGVILGIMEKNMETTMLGRVILG